MFIVKKKYSCGLSKSLLLVGLITCKEVEHMPSALMEEKLAKVVPLLAASKEQTIIQKNKMCNGFQ